MNYHSVMLREVYRDIAKRISEKQARLILKERAGLDWNDILSAPEMILDQERLQLIYSDFEKITQGMPLSRLYGSNEFWSMEFQLSEDTLDPRADSETIIDAALKHFKQNKPKKIIDLGTGSGCLLIALLHEFHEAYGYGIDCSYNAVSTARLNAQRNHVSERSYFCCGDWASGINANFDLIVSNPPYIATNVIPELSPEVRNFDPILALDGGKDGFDAYRIIFSSLKSLMAPGAIALFEIGYDQEIYMMRLVEDHGFLLHDVHRDLAGQPRVVEISCGDK